MSPGMPLNVTKPHNRREPSPLESSTVCKRLLTDRTKP
jgi:hypothetical protein